MGKKVLVALTMCFGMVLGAFGTARASGETAAILPPMSVPMAKYLAANPDAKKAMMASLAQTAGSTPRFVTSAGGTWANVTLALHSGGFVNPFLLTDGSVVVQTADNRKFWKLSPDAQGNYADGTWTQLADLPKIGGVQYAPLYHAGAVLPDGRLIFMGGEYNGSDTEVWTNLGAIYDPIANSWTPVSAPTGAGWSMIGDAQSIVLPSGQFLLASCCSYKPPSDAILNPQTLGWTETGAPRHGGSYQDEQGYSLLPDGDVLTVDIWTDYNSKTEPTNTELYVPKRQSWVAGPQLRQSVTDQRVCGTYEIGPAVMRGDDTLVQFGANTGCPAGGSRLDPTQVLDITLNKWIQGPYVPVVCGKTGRRPCTLPDAPAAVMNDAKILFAASSGYGEAPTHFFEFDPNNVIVEVSDPLENSKDRGAYTYSLLDLPNGQVLMSDFSSQLEVYTPADPQVDDYAPIITSAPKTVQPGGTYTLAGLQLGGRTQGVGYGDDEQMATNFPIIRFTNMASGDVVYARSMDFSGYSVADNAPSAASFTVPTGIETGASKMSVIANGAASAPIMVNVQ